MVETGRRKWRLITILCLSGLLLLPVLFQGIIVGKESTRKIQDLYNRSIANNMDSLSINIGFYLTLVQDFVQALSMDPVLTRQLLNEDKEENMNAALQNYTKKYTVRVPVNIQIITDNEAIYGNSPLNEAETADVKQRLFQSSFYINNVKFDDKHIHTMVADDYHQEPGEGRQRFIYFMKNIIQDDRHLGYLIVSINQTLIQRLLHQVEVHPETDGFLLDKDGTVVIGGEYMQQDLSAVSGQIAAQWNGDLGYRNFQTLHNEQQVIVSYQAVPFTDWILATQTPVSSLGTETKELRRLVVFVVLGSFVIMIMILGLIIKQITLPIVHLSRVVKTFEIQREPKKYRYKGIFELEILYEGLYQMIDRIQSQFRQIKEDERERRILELNRLMAQIRPHFLHNAISAVRWMAEMKGEKQISRALRLLSNMLNYTLNRSDEKWSTLSEELDYVHSYVSFEQIRMMGKLDLRIEWVGKTKDAYIPRMSIQPFVENAVCHGFLGLKTRNPEIRIVAMREEDDVILVITDNGVGMELETCTGILQPAAREEQVRQGIGVGNVTRRLQLEFGARFEIQINSTPGEGTEIRLHFPYRTAKEGTRYEGHDC